jgi:patatin-related protein
MGEAAAGTGLAPAIENPYAHEVRFGVVMYGGVSLAIYINGVTNELYEMACATPKVGEAQGAGGTRDVYRKASWLLLNPDLRKSFADYAGGRQKSDPLDDPAALDTAQRTRFVVDTIAGTSAGGINGLFLAKALANGQEFAPLKTLWIQEGDINGLLNDKGSYKGLEFAKTGSPPQSLLNSDRMYVKLLDALDGMKPAIKPTDKGESALVDEIDLFVTTTDIRGAVVPLRLFDKVVYEKRYKQVYHFQYAAGGDAPRNDLANDRIPFLAFAARCTSSFPFAFEPMCVLDAERLCNARSTEEVVNFGVWKSFFTGLSLADMTSDRWRSRAFGDGGYLDNKPFSYVVDALSWRLGGLPMERKLIYVEPAPTHPETERQDSKEKPDAIQNAVAAVFSIPQDETIREDLEAVLTRNRRIERVERIVREGESDIEARAEDPFARIKLDQDGKVPTWRSRDMTDMINYYGVAFLPYRRLRMMAATDDIADRLAVWWGIDRRSDRLYALRAIVRVWREDKYYEHRDPDPDRQKAIDSKKESVNAFLDDYDVKYRLRRAGFVLRRVHQFLSLARTLGLPDAERSPMSDIEIRLLARWESHKPRLPSMNSKAVFDVLNRLARGFGVAMGELRAATWQPAPSASEDERKAADERRSAFDTLDQVLRLLLGEAAALKELATSTGTQVKLPASLPAPSPLRTLQENVFTRAKFLFERAAEAQKTRIQELLEADVELLRTAYAKVIRSSPGRQPPLIRDLLGNPQLKVQQEAGRDKPKVIIEVGDVALPDCAALNTVEGKAVREFLADYYVRFDEYDQMSFPLYYDTGTGEPATVEVLRVSPEDAPSLIDELGDKGNAGHQRKKLAGTEVFHFGAFLDARWRRNDIMWGRLDGCERLLTALFPEAADQDIRDALLNEAQLTIVREEMQPGGYDQLIDNFATALAAQNANTLGSAFASLLAHLGPAGSSQRKIQTARILKGLLGDAGMVNYVKQYYEVNRELDTQTTLKTSARALTITGQILEEAEKRRQQPSRMVWVTRTGRGLQALLAISTPGSLPQALSRHWLALLYMFETVIVAGAMLLSAPAARTFGLTVLGLTFALHLASLLTGDLIGRKRGRIILIFALLSIVVLVLAALGILALHNHGLHGVMCVGDQQKDVWILWILCRLL